MVLGIPYRATQGRNTEKKVAMEENLYTPDCIRTFTGKYLNVFDPENEMFCIEDMAHSLSNLPRFNGHLRYFYSSCGNYSCTLSVAQHVCNGIDWIKENGGSKEEQLAFAFHEIGESSGLGDVAGPVKKKLADLTKLEESIQAFIAPIFNIPAHMSERLKLVDKLMLEKEWNEVMLNKNPNYEVWFPHKAKDELLKRYYALTEKK